MCEFNLKNKTNKAHDCRLNHHGTAKSMEADGAVDLIVNTRILKDLNAKVGVFIGDNDSSSIHAIQELINYTIIKQSDINHNKKGVGNFLYKLRENINIDVDQELSHDIIAYLKNTFATIIKKNKNNKQKIEEDLQNLAYHVFDIHENCGSYCKYVIEKVNYDNSRHMTNLTLFKHIKGFFSDLASNAHKFVLAGLSGLACANESLNNTMASYCPKSYSFSTSESADYKYACTVAHKKLGSDYILKVFEKLNLTKIKRKSNSIKKE